MSAIVAVVVKFTFGLLSKKVCAYSSEKLQQGGLADKQFRSLIVGELDDINLRLDANARKELKYGISCLQEGVDRLDMSFGSVAKIDSVDGAAPSQPSNAMPPPHSQPNSLPSMDVKHVFALAHAIGKLKRTECNNRYQSAMESFNKAADNSGLAFCNEALSNIEDRILACKIRITSRILEHLDDQEFAARDCKRYLNELHELSDIQQIFNVHVHGGFKAYFSRERRAEIIESVIAINLFLLDFVTKCTSTGTALSILDWSLITCKSESYHPIYTDRSSETMKQMGVTPPWSIESPAILNSKGVSAVNSKGDIIICPFDKTDSVLKKFERETCQLQHFDIPHSLGDDTEDIKCNYLAVDEEDTVYLLTRYGCYGHQPSFYNLSVFDAHGNIKCHKHVGFLNGKECRSFEVTKHKLIFCCEFEQNAEYALNLRTVIYICDRNGHLKNSFPANLPDNRLFKDMFSPIFNEIVLVAAKKHDKSSITLYVFTLGPEEMGHFVRKIKLELPSGLISSSSCTVRYNYLKNNVICFARSIAGSLCKYLVEFCAKTGEMRRLYNLNITPSHLGIGAPNFTSHPNGNMVLVFKNGALYLQTHR